MDFIVNKYAAQLGSNRQLVQQVFGSNPPSNEVMDVGKAMIDQIAAFDPDKVKKYTQWLIELLLKRDIRFEDLGNAKNVLRKFDKIKPQLPQDQRDIRRFKAMADLEDVVNPITPQLSKREENKAYEQEMYEQAEVVYNTEQYRIVVPKTEEASCYFGVNTRWCTAATDGHNYFNDYNREGPLYVILDKKNNERWQFHFESKQFMDERDQSVDLSTFSYKHPEIVKFFSNKVLVSLEFSSVSEFVGDKGDDTAKWIMNICDGADHLNIYENNIDKYMKKDLLRGLDAETLTKLGEWMQNKYSSEIEENGYDMLNVSDILELQDYVEDDDLDRAFSIAVSTGSEVGAENEMTEALSRAINDVPGLQYRNEAEWQTGSDWNWDSQIKIELNFKDAIDSLGKYDDISSIEEKVEVKVEQPRYGFNGYDEDAATERFGEEIHELLAE